MKQNKLLMNIFAGIILFVLMTFSVNAVQSNTSLETTSDLDIQREEIKSGHYNDSDGETLRVRTSAQNVKELSIRGIEARTNLNISAKTDSEGKTEFTVRLRNGEEREIMIMPDTASENALAALRVNVCSSDNNCTIELKTVGTGTAEEVQYEVELEQRSRILGIFPRQMDVSAHVDAQTGETNVRRPWWSFMATTQAE